MAKQQEAIRERVHTNIREPRKYKVLIHNDDFTTMDFVVMILKVVFFKTDTEAETLMLSSQAVVGVYSYDVALSKVKKATDMARHAGFPLRLTCQPG